MTTIEGPHTHRRHEDKFLRTINANLYYGKGYPQYLHGENKEESIPVFEAVKKYILQDRPHLKGTHPIYNRMLREGILILHSQHRHGFCHVVSSVQLINESYFKLVAKYINCKLVSHSKNRHNPKM